jgi:hypothetical protein
MRLHPWFTLAWYVRPVAKGHPVIRSLDPELHWQFCFVDQRPHLA